MKMDVSSYFSMNEEETSDTFKVFPKNKNTREENLLPQTIFLKTPKNIPNNQFITFWKNIYFDTVSPPPEFSDLIG